MSICPNCHQMDKNFFAPQCHNCNEHVGLFEQCAHSFVFTVVNVVAQIAMVIGVIYFIGWLFSG